MAALDRIGDEVAVTPVGGTDEFSGTVTALAGGRTLYAWVDDSTGEYSRDLVGIIYGADGQPEGERFVITRAPYEQIFADFSALPDGGFIAAWRTQLNPISRSRDFDIQVQRFDPDGARIGRAAPLADVPSGGRDGASVTVLTDGSYVVSWSEYHGSGGSFDAAIRAQHYSAAGRRLGRAIDVTTGDAGTQTDPQIVATSGGGYAIAWVDQAASNGLSAIRLQHFSVRGRRIGEEIVVSAGVPIANAPALATLADGSIAVAFANYDFRAGASEIFVTRIGADGALGPVRQVNLPTDELQIGPDIAALGDGGYVVTFTDFSRTGGDAQGASVKAQVYRADDSRRGDAILVNTETRADQGDARVAVTDGDRVTITWTDTSPPVDGYVDLSIRSQTFIVAAPEQPFQGSTGDDLFTAPDDRDWRLDGVEGDDHLTAAGGDDTLIGGAGNDVLVGGTGEDRFEVGARDGFDRVDGGSGVDTIRALADEAVIGLSAITGIERVDASGFAPATIRGDASANVLDFSAAELLGIAAIEGGRGDDVILGGAGDDVVRGGAGRDRLSGGLGFDVFEGTLAEVRGDTILDMSFADRLVVTDFGYHPGRSTFNIRGDRIFLDPDGAGGQDAVAVTIAGLRDAGSYTVSFDEAGALTFSVY